MTQRAQLAHQSRCQRSRFARLATVGLLLAVALSTVTVTPSAEAADQFDPLFPRPWTINFTDCEPTCEMGTPVGIDAQVVLIDSQRRRIYSYRFNELTPIGIGVVDADRVEQIDWIDLGPNGLNLPAGFTRVTLDTARNRMFIGQANGAAGCEDVNLQAKGCAVSDARNGDLSVSTPQFAVLDLTRRSVEFIEIAAADTPDAVMAGQSVAAFAVDAARERLYVLADGGSLFEQGFVAAGFDPAGPAIVAYDTTSLGPDSAPLWVYRPRACAAVLRDKPGRAVPFGLGHERVGTEEVGFLYFPCHGTAQLLSPARYPPGIVRVNLHDATATDSTDAFSTEWFNFAGDLIDGWAFGDLVNHRIVLGVGGVGPNRVYVFDVLHRAWTGRLVLGSGGFGGGGVDPASGRIYVYAGRDLGLRVIDPSGLPAVVRANPVGIGDTPPTMTELTVDPLTRRVVRAGGPGGHLVIYEDRIPPFVPAPPVDPDDKTHDIDEGDAVQVTHTAAGSAYGARVQLARGLRGLPLGGAAAQFLDATPFRIEGGDRGLFLSQIRQAMVTGQSRQGDATASANAARMGESTESDVRAKYDAVMGPITEGADESAECDQSSPGPECLEFDTLVQSVGALRESQCSNFGGADDPNSASEPGSSVECRPLDRASAWSSSSAEQPGQAGPVLFGVAHTEATVDAVKDPAGGVVTTSSAVARGVNITIPNAGSLSIGEIESTAVSRAMGRPDTDGVDCSEEPTPVGCTKSTLHTVAKNVRILDASGEETLFSCGVTGADADPDDNCDLSEVAREVNQYFASSIRARGPRQELDPLVVNSPGGARAVVTKDFYAFANDLTLHGDAQREVTGLELTIYNDNWEPSRVIVELAGVYSEAQYQIGVPKPPEFTEPTKLSIALLDDVGQPLEGGVFQVRETDALGLSGPLVAACVTGDDGVGDCQFDGLAAGEYVISETAAPAGYAPADDATISLLEGLHTEVVFTNLQAVGRIGISLTDDGGETGTPGPLAGATFGVVSDDGDLVRGAGDQPYDECTTDAEGTCSFEDVPLGAYVVYQKAAPEGYLTADDVGFVLELPGQAAALSFVTGLEGIEGTAGSRGNGGSTAEDTTGDETARDTAFVDDPTETTTVIIEEPPMRPAAQVSTSPLDRPSGLRRVIGLPGEAAGFLRRQPLQATLFGLVWLLLGTPVYLAVRRRTLTIAKEVV